MPRWNLAEHLSLAAHAVRWTLLAAPLAAGVGSLCALFLWSLDLCTRTRESHPWLLFLLPVAGIGIALLYRLAGRSVEAGNNLIVDELHEPTTGVPLAMAPVVLVATLATHLFGGSAGREGTAVQMGGSLASAAARWLRLRDPRAVRKLVMAGVAAGFAGVFGTPLAGAVFAMEFIAAGRLGYEAIFPCLVAAIVGDRACVAWGIHHTRYAVAVGATPFEWALAAKVAGAAVVFGLAGALFIELTHAINAAAKRTLRHDWLRPFVGGLIVIALVFVAGTRDYLGLGVTSPDPYGVSIISSFSSGGADALSWAWKLLFTAVTLGFGFKGGEVTPLFFIGATLGNALSRLAHAPTDLFAAIGFVGLFAGATNTPLACTLMGIELFGSGHAIYLAIACFVAYLFSGHRSIYASQRVGVAKGDL